MKSKSKDVFMYALAALSVLLFAWLIRVVFDKELPAANHDLALLLLGALSSNVTLIYSYFFGSSKGSSDKNELIKQP